MELVLLPRTNRRITFLDIEWTTLDIGGRTMESKSSIKRTFNKIPL